jgi:hypothetical protein
MSDCFRAAISGSSVTGFGRQTTIATRRRYLMANALCGYLGAMYSDDGARSNPQDIASRVSSMSLATPSLLLIW